MIAMAVNNGSSPATHFGRQMRKERLARGWSLREFPPRARGSTSVQRARSRMASARRPRPWRPGAMRRFPSVRAGLPSTTRSPSRECRLLGLRSWAEHEDKAVRLEVWSPGIVHGLFQTEDYARAFIAALPGVTADAASARLAGSMERQRRVLVRDVPRKLHRRRPQALYRCVGSPEDHGRPDAPPGRDGHAADRHAAGASARRPSGHGSEPILADDTRRTLSTWPPAASTRRRDGYAA